MAHFSESRWSLITTTDHLKEAISSLQQRRNNSKPTILKSDSFRQWRRNNSLTDYPRERNSSSTALVSADSCLPKNRSHRTKARLEQDAKLPTSKTYMMWSGREEQKQENLVSLISGGSEQQLSPNKEWGSYNSWCNRTALVALVGRCYGKAWYAAGCWQDSAKIVQCCDRHCAGLQLASLARDLLNCTPLMTTT